MKKVSLGYDPAPPGQYPIKRIVVDSDMDGLTCGAMLKIVYPHAQVLQADSAEVVSGALDTLIDSSTATADLHYRAGVGLYFDHHAGSMPETTDFPGRWQDSWSAARVVYDYFKAIVELEKFAEILPDLDKFDTGHISLSEFLEPGPVMKLALSIKRDAQAFNLRLVGYLAQMRNFAEVLAIAEVKARVSKMLQLRSQLFDFINSHHDDHGEVVFVDITGFSADLKTSGYYFNSQFPHSQFEVVFKKGSANKIKVRFYGNIFNPDGVDVDLLPLAKAISSNAGGHKLACGFISEPGETVEQLQEKIVREIERSGIIS